MTVDERIPNALIMKENEGALAMVITGERLEYYYLIIVFSGTLLNI